MSYTEMDYLNDYYAEREYLVGDLVTEVEHFCFLANCIEKQSKALKDALAYVDSLNLLDLEESELEEIIIELLALTELCEFGNKNNQEEFVRTFINCFKLVKGKSDILQMPDSDKSDTSPPDGYILKIDNETVIKNKIK